MGFAAANEADHFSSVSATAAPTSQRSLQAMAASSVDAPAAPDASSIGGANWNPNAPGAAAAAAVAARLTAMEVAGAAITMRTTVIAAVGLCWTCRSSCNGMTMCKLADTQLKLAGRQEGSCLRRRHSCRRQLTIGSKWCQRRFHPRSRAIRMLRGSKPLLYHRAPQVCVDQVDR